MPWVFASLHDAEAAELLGHPSSAGPCAVLRCTLALRRWPLATAAPSQGNICYCRPSPLLPCLSNAAAAHPLCCLVSSTQVEALVEAGSATTLAGTQVIFTLTDGRVYAEFEGLAGARGLVLPLARAFKVRQGAAAVAFPNGSSSWPAAVQHRP